MPSTPSAITRLVPRSYDANVTSASRSSRFGVPSNFARPTSTPSRGGSIAGAISLISLVVSPVNRRSASWKTIVSVIVTPKSPRMRALPVRTSALRIT